ncbi:Fungal specific transcription factor [Penicillium nucicola]|uniref:Fungal specific transcription factor n=1 Tax=Penicillium nucicola TaxID=1850975 RepID=UPI00254594CD|nr:Fungal specific transcription factor [Penicillium nucicola]KAJ5766237.1 Fungal specific transcription factor [Penicillium nucicola]
MNTQACDRCRRRKSRCDKISPSCGPCRKVGTACKYVDRAKDRREMVERLQRRLKQAEANNSRLAARLAHSELGTSPQTEFGRASEPSPDPDVDQSAEDEDGGRDRGDEVMEEVSFLSRRAGGEHHFLGSASGIPFANLVSTTVEVTSRNCQKRASGPTGIQSTPKSSALPFDAFFLPPERVARDLHRAYFENDHLSYPFLHRGTAIDALNRAYADTQYLERDSFAGFAFDMILAIATASVHKFDLESLPNAEGYQLRAAQRLHKVLEKGSIQALQAILLLGQYRMISSIQDTSSSMWHIVGIASRMCLELGLHREQVYKVPRGTGSSDTSQQLIAHEVRRRCFWCVVAMDRVVSITLGRPLAIHLQDADVALPDPSLDAIVNHCESDTDQLPPTFCRTALFVHIVRYRIICGDILSALHSGSTRTQTDEVPALAARERLANELATWRRDTADLSLSDVDLSSTLPGDRSSFRTREWYEILYHNALLMLYRPSPGLSSASSRDAVVLQTIFVAAKQAITLYAHLHRSRRINYTWITLHSVFMAGLSYVYAVGRHFRSHKWNLSKNAPTALLDTDPTIFEIVNDSRVCSNVLVAISERWNVTKNCHDVFNRLSDAMLSDAVEYHTKRSGPTGDMMPNSSISAGVTANPTLSYWSIDETGPASLAVDSVLHECFEDLQSFQPYGCGDDPVGQLSHDWLGEIGGMGLHMPPIW